jgi:hypothetical protein
VAQIDSDISSRINKAGGINVRKFEYAAFLSLHPNILLELFFCEKSELLRNSKMSLNVAQSSFSQAAMSSMSAGSGMPMAPGGQQAQMFPPDGGQGGGGQGGQGSQGAQGAQAMNELIQNLMKLIGQMMSSQAGGGGMGGAMG